MESTPKPTQEQQNPSLDASGQTGSPSDSKQFSDFLDTLNMFGDTITQLGEMNGKPVDRGDALREVFKSVDAKLAAIKAARESSDNV